MCLGVRITYKAGSHHKHVVFFAFMVYGIIAYMSCGTTYCVLGLSMLALQQAKLLWPVRPKQHMYEHLCPGLLA